MVVLAARTVRAIACLATGRLPGLPAHASEQFLEKRTVIALVHGRAAAELEPLVPPRWRCEALARLPALADSIVGGALLHIGEHRMGFVDFAHALDGIRRLADVRMVFARQLALGLLDVNGSRIAGHAQHLVVVLELHHDPSCREEVGQKPVALPFDNGVALATATLQAPAVEHRDMARLISDQADSLQFQRSFGHAPTSDAQHVGDELVRHDQIIALQPVHAMQQVAADLLFNRVMAVAHGSLGHLRHEGLRVPKHQIFHGRMPLELVLDPACLEPETLARTAHNGLAGAAFSAHERRDARDAVAPHHGDFRRTTVVQHIEQRHDGAGGKIHMAGHLPCLDPVPDLVPLRSGDFRLL